MSASLPHRSSIWNYYNVSKLKRLPLLRWLHASMCLFLLISCSMHNGIHKIKRFALYYPCHSSLKREKRAFPCSHMQPFLSNCMHTLTDKHFSHRTKLPAVPCCTTVAVSASIHFEFWNAFYLNISRAYIIKFP